MLTAVWTSGALQTIRALRRHAKVRVRPALSAQWGNGAKTSANTPQVQEQVLVLVKAQHETR